jgi:hypothetical protein
MSDFLGYDRSQTRRHHFLRDASSRNQPTQEQQRVAPQSGYAQYEAMPEVYKTRGGQEIVMTRKSLIEVANRDAFAFREIVRRFGADGGNDARRPSLRSKDHRRNSNARTNTI